MIIFTCIIIRNANSKKYTWERELKTLKILDRPKFRWNKFEYEQQGLKK